MNKYLIIIMALLLTSCTKQLGSVEKFISVSIGSKDYVFTRNITLTKDTDYTIRAYGSLYGSNADTIALRVDATLTRGNVVLNGDTTEVVLIKPYTEPGQLDADFSGPGLQGAFRGME